MDTSVCLFVCLFTCTTELLKVPISAREIGRLDDTEDFPSVFVPLLAQHAQNARSFSAAVGSASQSGGFYHPTPETLNRKPQDSVYVQIEICVDDLIWAPWPFSAAHLTVLLLTATVWELVIKNINDIQL